jgi:hypothetical protein
MRPEQIDDVSDGEAGAEHRADGCGHGATTRRVLRERPMLLYIAIGALLGGVAGGLIALAVASQKPSSPPPQVFRQDEKDTLLANLARLGTQVSDLANRLEPVIGTANRLNTILLSRQRLVEVEGMLARGFDPERYADKTIPGHPRYPLIDGGMSSLFRRPPWMKLAEFNDYRDRRDRKLREANILPESQPATPEERTRRFTIELTAMHEHLQATKQKLEITSKLPDPAGR